MKEPTQDRFLKDVAEHQMTIVRASGVERYLRFRKPDNGNMWFDILTWPQTLVIDGDMGTWVFSMGQKFGNYVDGLALPNGSLKAQMIIAELKRKGEVSVDIEPTKDKTS